VIIPNLKLYLYGAAVASVFAFGFYVKGVFTDYRIANMEADYADERAMAAEHAAAYEAKFREVETSWRARVEAAEAEAAAAIKVRDARIGALNATTGKLQQRIAHLTETNGTPTDPGTAIRDLSKRVVTLGTLVGELDSFAGQVAATADTLREELALCRQYALSVTTANVR
jgi:hypothetical protein